MSLDLEQVQIGNDQFYKIANSDTLRPFFMSIVSDSNHWMFISSNGGLTAGRKNAEFALFPYYTDDKITESVEVTGSKSIFRVEKDGKTQIWEPFSDRYEGRFEITRNLYKNIYGNKVRFEEVNHDLGLTYNYEWNSSANFGFVRKSTLINNGDKEVKVELLDGVQNIMPYGVASDLQNASSNLVDAYKRCELEQQTGIGIFALSAIIIDRAEPSEALKANIVWSMGLDNPTYLLSATQLKAFRKGMAVTQEVDVKAKKGAYFLNASITLAANAQQQWNIVANVNQTQPDVVRLAKSIREDQSLETKVFEDVEQGTERLIALNAAADGLQSTADSRRDTRHFANVLFNIMRGGIFDDNYQIEKGDFSKYLRKANPDVYAAAPLDQLAEIFTLADLKGLASKSTDVHFRRLCMEYLPLKFSRRHGDPSRPWNKFSINTQSEVDGSKILDYQGNWRDIFQNWEALAHSYPNFMESMIHKFLNATTFDGYNPYRVTKDGFDWESIEPDNPWSYIGYWGDHQIIYLLKFLEFIEAHQPGKLESAFNEEVFVYANVPYKIKSYADILKNSKDTIAFDEESDKKIRSEKASFGADAGLLKNKGGKVHTANFIEKMLATVLAKLSNFIPEGGIWMNTQRPEWNDANNALVGNGVSMVTLYYLRRFLKFTQDILEKTETKEAQVSAELLTFFKAVVQTFDANQSVLSGKVNDKDRKTIMDGLGEAGSQYRSQIYEASFSGKKATISIADLLSFTQLSLRYLEHSIDANQRTDKLYHAYNLMTVENDQEVSIAYLDEMLEGQVAVLSSGYLTSTQALEVLDGLKNSALFREDQYSYILYPNKDLAGFLAKSNINGNVIAESKLLSKLVADGNLQIVQKDVEGAYHFNGNFRNADDLKAGLESLDSSYDDLVTAGKAQVLEAFEEVFNHKAFTGRSGTFFGYEGLGSIYWHMVSKLLLAAQECCLKAIHDGEDAVLVGRLLEHFYEINAGIGVHKPPSVYGAFSTDPYSHTPGGKGAQQPGMTGQVKEDVISRFGELGVSVKNSQLVFYPCLLRKGEFLETATKFEYIDIESNKQSLSLPVGSLCFTYCQVPVVYQLSDKDGIEVHFANGSKENVESLTLGLATSQELFSRNGAISKIHVSLQGDMLK